jgi:hypothetical protein
MNTSKLIDAAKDENIYKFKKELSNIMAKLTLREENEYEKFFNKKLKSWKIKSPSELSKEDKKKFFDEIDKEWKG